MPPQRTRARIGDLQFHSRYPDPIVDVDTEAITVEKDTINDEIIVQHLGRRADRLTVSGIINEDQVWLFDELVQGGEVFVRTHRWTGSAIVVSATSDYTQSYDAVIDDRDPGDSPWLYEVEIELVEVEEVPNVATGTGQQSFVDL